MLVQCLEMHIFGDENLAPTLGELMGRDFSPWRMQQRLSEVQ